MNAIVRRGWMVMVPASRDDACRRTERHQCTAGVQHRAGARRRAGRRDERQHSAAARAALADLKDFLPYRSYRVLDTAWVLASSATRQAVSSRLQGLTNRTMKSRSIACPSAPRHCRSDSRCVNRTGAPNAEPPRDREAALRTARAVAAQRLSRVSSARRGGSESRRYGRASSTPRRDGIGDRDAAERLAGRLGGTTLIDTSFTMSLGETVVVGTSRMRGGNKALIVLFTAATKGTKPRE